MLFSLISLCFLAHIHAGEDVALGRCCLRNACLGLRYWEALHARFLLHGTERHEMEFIGAGKLRVCLYVVIWYDLSYLCL